MMTLAEQLEAERWLRRRDVLRLTGWSAATLYRRIKLSGFPAPMQDGSCAYWRAGDVLAYLKRERPAETGQAIAQRALQSV